MKFNNFENLGFAEQSSVSMSDTAPSSFSPHWHTYGEIILCTDAHACNTYVINGKDRIRLRFGDILWIWPLELHEIVDASHQFIFQYNNQLIDAVQDLRQIESFFRGRNLFRASEHPALNKTLVSCLQEIRRVHFSDDEFRELKCVMLFHKILLALGKSREEFIGTLASEREDLVYQRIMRTCDYVRQNITENISLERVAMLTGVSPWYFSKLFREYFNQTYISWYNEQRVQKSVSILINEQSTLTEVAWQSGFQSISSFNRVFKQYRGVSPSEYRKMHAQQERHFP